MKGERGTKRDECKVIMGRGSTGEKTDRERDGRGSGAEGCRRTER